MKVYRIKDWKKHYENNRTAEMVTMRWVPFPNKHDGDGYTQLVSGPDGAAMLGAWVACVQVASRCQPRGTLLRVGGKPHDPESISRITRLKSEVIAKLMERTTHPDIGWMEVVELSGVIEYSEIPQEPAKAEGGGIPFPSFPFPSLLDTENFRKTWGDWISHRKEIKKKVTATMVKKQLKRLEKLGHDSAIAAIDRSIANGWTGIFPDEKAKSTKPRTIDNGQATKAFAGERAGTERGNAIAAAEIDARMRGAK